MYIGIFIAVFLAVFLGIKLSKWDSEQWSKFGHTLLLVAGIILGLGIVGGVIYGIVYLTRTYREELSIFLISVLYIVGAIAIFCGIFWFVGFIGDLRKKRLVSKLGKKGYEKYLKDKEIKKEKRKNSWRGRNWIWVSLSAIPFVLIIIPLLIGFLIALFKGEL